MREIYRLAKEPAAFQVGLCSMDLFICYLFIYLFGFWLVGCLVSLSVIQSVSLFVSQSWLMAYLFVCLFGWLVGCLVGWLAG